MNRNDHSREVELRARRVYHNPQMWDSWHKQMMVRSNKARIQHFLASLRLRFNYRLSRNDEPFNHSSLAIATNLCIILTALVLLLSIAIFA